MQNITLLGIAVGLAFAFAIILDGLSGFLWALLFAALGGVIGAHFEGRIDLKALVRNVLDSRGGRG